MNDKISHASAREIFVIFVKPAADLSVEDFFRLVGFPTVKFFEIFRGGKDIDLPGCKRAKYFSDVPISCSVSPLYVRRFGRFF